MHRVPLPPRRARVACLFAVAVALAPSTLRLPHARAAQEPETEGILRLPSMTAAGMRLDTVLLGGYASGRFVEAMETLGAQVDPEERVLVGTYLEKVFGSDGEPAGLGRTGRLRVAVERAIRPDGSTRSVRVLAAEMAVSGTVRTAFYYDAEGEPGFYDPFGRPLESDGWAKPLGSARVTSRFGLRRMHPILGRVLPHTGVDYAARSGTPVRATADGVVSFAGLRGGYGTMVEIRHPNGYVTRYAHLSALAATATPGTPVKQGDVVGRVGMTGLATGPHLHYEVRRSGRPVDPASVREAATVTGLGGDPGWPRARAQLSALLARAPAAIHAR